MGEEKRRQGCSRMRQDLITPYNVLFCGCLAYTPGSRMPSREHREHTDGPLLPPLVSSRHLSRSYLPSPSLHRFLSLSLVFRSFLSRSFSTSSSYSSCPSVGGLCVRAIRPACNLYLPPVPLPPILPREPVYFYMPFYTKAIPSPRE